MPSPESVMESLPRPRPVAVESTQQPIYTVDILLSVPTIAVEPLMAVLQSALQQLGQGPPSRGAPPSAYTQQQARAQLWAPAPAPKNEKISPMPNSVPTAAGGSLQVLKVLQAMKPPEKKGSSPRCDRERLPSSEADDGVHHQNVITKSRLRRASREAEDDMIQKDYRLQPAERMKNVKRCVNIIIVHSSSIIIVHEEKVSSRMNHDLFGQGPAPGRWPSCWTRSKRLHCRFAKASRIDALWLLLPSVGEATSTCADGCGRSSRPMKR